MKMKKTMTILVAINTLFSFPVAAQNLYAPNVSVVWNYDTSKTVQVAVSDSSTAETGYRIYRDSGFSSSFRMIAEIVSTTPAGKGQVIYHDSTTAPNAWYRYKAAAYSGTDSVLGNPCTTYTFRSMRPAQVAHFIKLSDFPISLTGWSALAGDSVILQDSSAPGGKYRVINVQNPSTPQAAGYIDSATLIGYPQKTLIPAYLRFGVFNGYGPGEINVLEFGCKLLIKTNGNFHLIDSSGDIADSCGICDSCPFSIMNNSVLRLNDSIWGIPFSASIAGTYYDFLNIIRTSYSKLVKVTGFQTGTAWSLKIMMSYSYTPHVLGLVDSKLIIGVDYSAFSGAGDQYVLAYDLQKGVLTRINGTKGGHSFGNCSGYFLTATQFLNLDAGTVYAEDVHDLDGYKTALSQNAVLTDSVPARLNVLIDSVNKRVYIVHTNTLSTYSYSFAPLGAKTCSAIPQLRQELKVLPGSGKGSGVTIILPASSRSAYLSFYDLSGRLIDRLTGITSDAVVWRPKRAGTGCYIVSAKIGTELLSARFIAR